MDAIVAKNEIERLRDGLLRIHIGSGQCLMTVDSGEVRTLLTNHPWRFCKETSPKSVKGYAISGYRNPGNRTLHTLLFHRMLMRPVKPEVVDHYNRNSLDCRPCNMRVTSVKVNAVNTTRKPRSGTIGVSKQRQNRGGRAYYWRANWTGPDGKVAYRNFSVAKYEDEAKYMAIYVRNMMTARQAHYVLAAVPPQGYDPSRHELNPKYFDASVDIDPEAPIAYISKDTK